MNVSDESKGLVDFEGAVCTVIDRNREAIIDLGEGVWARAESGFGGYETARRVAGLSREMGLPCREGLGLTGVRAEPRGAQMGATIALLGERDATILPDHPAADSATGAVHACGHHAQLAGFFGAALALDQPSILNRLAGRIVSMAVPAEEHLGLGFRRQLVRDNRIRFLGGGKQALIRLGRFRDASLAMMIHTCAGRIALVFGS